MWPRELQVEALGKEKGLKERGIFCRGGKQVIGAQVLKFAWGKPGGWWKAPDSGGHTRTGGPGEGSGCDGAEAEEKELGL